MTPVTASYTNPYIEKREVIQDLKNYSRGRCYPIILHAPIEKFQVASQTTIIPKVNKPVLRATPIKLTVTMKQDTPRDSSPVFDDTFTQVAQTYNVDKTLLQNIAKCESGFRPEATNGIYGGMFQFSSSTWISTRQRMGENPDPNLRFDGKEAIKSAAYKISKDGTGAWLVCQYHESS